MKPSRLFIPPRYALLRKIFRDRPFRMLDVGCGHQSFALAKRYLPKATYHGVDKRRKGEPSQYDEMDRFFDLDLQRDSLDPIENDRYDAIVFSHTIEHLANGEEVLRALVPKLKVGGYLYLEFPSLKSLYLPSAEGTLNFFDDPTHIRVYDVKELCNLLLACRMRVLRAGRARNLWRAALLGPVALLHSAAHWLRHGRLSAKGLADLVGFADYILAVRHDIPLEKRLGSWEATATLAPVPG